MSLMMTLGFGSLVREHPDSCADSNKKTDIEMVKYFCKLAITVLLINSSWASWFPSPTFVETPTNISVREGLHAFLPCAVANLGDRSITWMRKKNLHIISAGMLTYAPDNRYRVLHPPNTNEWTLHIKQIQKDDEGFYECQVNSDPKITRAVTLIVIDKDLDDPFYQLAIDPSDNKTKVDISGPLERYIQEGSILGVTCTIPHPSTQGPKAVIWYHGGRKLAYDSMRGGISLQIDKSAKITISKLLLSAVTPKDSGRYTCRPTNGGSASITVHVQSGQHEAAVQQSGHNSSKESEASLRIFLFIYLFLHLTYKKSFT